MAAATTDTEVAKMPWADEQFNECVDEVVSATGTAHVIRHTTTNANGQTNTYSLSFAGASGVGFPSGARYIETFVENESNHMSSTGLASEMTHTETLVLNRLGEDGAPTKDDYLLHVEAHMTISASGVVNVHDLEFKPSCR